MGKFTILFLKRYIKDSLNYTYPNFQFDSFENFISNSLSYV